MQTVLLYGNSLAVSTIGASLQACPDLQVLSVDPSLPGAIQCPEELQSAIVIFDPAAGHPDFSTNLWKAIPHLLLLGVEPSSDKMLVLSGGVQQVLSVADLVAAINKER